MTNEALARRSRSDRAHVRGVGRATVLACAFLVAACSGTEHATPVSTESAGHRGIAVVSDSTVHSLLVNACYNCHSNEKRTPWYGTLAPSYWFSERALRSLNFSAWLSYDMQRQAAEFDAIARVIEAGEMPPGDYTLFDPSARLTKEQKQTLLAWASHNGH